MKDKLRELAERWKNRDYDDMEHLQWYAMGIRQARDELLEILDSEGDGEADERAVCELCKGRCESFNEVHNRMMTCPECRGTGKKDSHPPAQAAQTELSAQQRLDEARELLAGMDFVVRRKDDDPLRRIPTAEQVAQVDKPPRLGGCCCGEPCTLGTVHRTDGPCFVYTQPADSGRVGDGAVERAAKAMWEVIPRGVPWSGEVTSINEWRMLARAAIAAQGQDWRIGMFDRWNEAAREKGYAGICEAINSVPPASPAGVPDGWNSVVSDALAVIKDAAQFHGELPVGMYRHIQPRLTALLAAAPSAPEGGEVGL